MKQIQYSTFLIRLNFQIIQRGFKKTIELAKKKLIQMLKSKTPNFQTLLKLWIILAKFSLDRLSNIFFNLNSAETSDEMQKLHKKFLLYFTTPFSNDIALNEDLFKRVKAVYDQKTL